MAPSTSQSGVYFGSLTVSEYASAMGLWRHVSCLIQKLGSLSGTGDFQLAALVMLTLSSSTVRSFHSIWLICCSSSSWSLIHWASSLCLTSCSSMFCQNFFTSPMSLCLVVSQSGWASFLVPCRILWHLP